MPEVKVLHLADMHLGWPFAAMGADTERSQLRREELKQVFAGIIDLAGQHQVDLLLIAGDLFEHTHVTRGLVQFIDQQFRRIPRTRVFISPGNHDPFLPDSYYQSYSWAPNVHIFGPEGERVDLPDLPVSVYGWGFGAWEVRECHLPELTAADPARINLAVVHGGEGAYHPFTPTDLAAMGADYVALGHIHKEGVLLQQNGRVVARYSGSPEALSFGEPGVHGIFLGTVSKQENRLAFVPTGLRQYLTMDVDVTGAVSLEDLADRIRQADQPEDRLSHCYRLTLVGAVDPSLTVELPVLTGMLAGEFYFLRLADATYPDYDLEQLAAERTPRGLFVRRLQEMADRAGGEAEQAVIRRALTLGLQAFGQSAAGKGGAR